MKLMRARAKAVIQSASMSDIIQRQHDVLREFALLDSDNEMLLLYLVKVGRELPRFGAVDRSERNVVKGCQSRVWLDTEYRNNRLYYAGDSDAAITRGLLSLLLRIYQGNSPEDILRSELFLVRDRNLSRFIGSAHTTGFATIDAGIREKARLYCEQADARPS